MTQRPGHTICATLLVASGATDLQICTATGDRKVGTTKNICGRLFAQDRKAILKAMNHAVTRLPVLGRRRPERPGSRTSHRQSAMASRIYPQRRTGNGFTLLAVRRIHPQRKLRPTIELQICLEVVG
jgi:hypothetical protein